MRRHVTVTRRTKGAVEMVRKALGAGRSVMARAPNGSWFYVTSFHCDLIDPLHPEWGVRWTATGRQGYGDQTAFMEVKSLNWFESEAK